MRTIDADALKRKVQRLATQAWKMKVKASVETILNQFIDDIDHAPTVDAVPVVHGKWEKHKGIFICSRCWTGYKEQPTMMGKPLFEFCPVCGARMDGKDGEGRE